MRQRALIHGVSALPLRGFTGHGHAITVVDVFQSATTLPRVRRAVLLLATGVMLVGPTALAFFSGESRRPPGCGRRGRLGLVLLLVLAGAAPWPASGRAEQMVGLVGLVVWSAVSLSWAPLAATASDSVQRLLLYLAALLMAVGLLRFRVRQGSPSPDWLSAHWSSSAMGSPAGCCRSRRARALDQSGRALEQPITYWNAEGLLAAIGLILCVRVAGRPPAAHRCARRPRRPAVRFGSVSTCPLARRGGGGPPRHDVLLAAAPNRAQLRAVLGGLLSGACWPQHARPRSVESRRCKARTEGATGRSCWRFWS